MIRKINRISIMIICLLLLTGCWDFVDINNKCIVISLGIDYVNENIEFSGEIAKLAASPEGKEEKAQPANVYNLLSYGKTFEEARIEYDAINPYPVFLGATRVVVFGENYAKRSIEPYLNRVDRLFDYRKTLLIVVSKEPPKELFQVKTEKDISVGFLIEDIIEHLRVKGETLYPSVGELLSYIAFEKIGYVIPYIGIVEGSIKYLGLAAMKDSKLVGIIDLMDTDGILYLLAEKPVLSEVINSTKNEKNPYSFRISIKKRKITTDYINDKTSISIDLDLVAELRYQYYIEPISDEEVKRLENMISEKVKEDIISIIKRAQKEFECDIFQFGKQFRAKHHELYRQLDWEEEFIRADVNVNVKTKIVNFSLTDPNAKKQY